MSRTRNQYGQALTEFVIVAIFFLVPLFMILPVLAKIISVRQDTETAVRYAAWERTVWNQTAPSNPDTTLAASTVKSDDQIALEVDQRIFSDGQTQVYTARSNPLPPDIKPFAMVQSGNADIYPILGPRADSTTSNPRYTSQASIDSEPPRLAKTLGQVFVEGLDTVFRFDLDTKGYVQSQLNVSLVRFPWLGSMFDLDALIIDRGNTLFTDAWNPGGRDHAEYLVAGLVPEELLLDNGAVHGIQDVVGLSPLRKDVRYDNLDFGYVNIDPVPASRLSNR
jgi:hypothetical protein